MCELQAAVPVAANLLSYHLRILREAGLIAGSRRGRWIDYRLDVAGFACVWAALERAGVPLPGSPINAAVSCANGDDGDDPDASRSDHGGQA